MGKQLFTLFFITILAGTSIGMIVLKFDPFKVSELVKLLFFSALFSFMWGLGTLAFFILNLGTSNRWGDSFRRGLFLSILFLILVFFKRHDFLSWYVGAATGGVFIVAEVIVYKSMNKLQNGETTENY